ncbi:histidine phosphatase family protein [uncultured Pelagimonas sp.]|uniref:histidine phosphatase family protein n=1 Tax=uncultured Pelagimonas sp. TaxID=1618102 RepID=UPI0026265D61|nr:histidine phosphatase family protein [uncultured Pelagimonas sp.]
MRKQKQAASERGITTVQMDAATELFFIRHAPVIGDGRMYGRRDVEADCSNAAAFAACHARLPRFDHVYCSPALRCVQTLSALFPGVNPRLVDALWEQDFGAWEGLPYAELPDLGKLDGAELAAFAPENGESFDDLCARVRPVLNFAKPGRTLVMAHAGTIRAALSVALGGVPTALRFDIANLSVTRLTRLSEGVYSINEVNRCT